MPTKKVRVLSVVIAGGLVFTGVTAAVVTPGHAPARAALAANTASSPPVNLDNCPMLSEGYQDVGCVSQLQTELNTILGLNLSVDGTFGLMTKKAVERFQQEHNIVPADGIVGPQTKAALDNPGSSSAGTPPGQLNPGQQITSGTQIASPDGKYALQMQSDGDLVLRAPGNTPLGDTHTAGHDGTIAVMQTDGNFVLRAPGNIPVWASGTNGHPGTVLQVQDDGNVVLYAPGHQALRVLFPATVPTPASSAPTPASSAPTPASSAPTPAPSATESTASVWSLPVLIPGFFASTIYFNKKQTEYIDSDESQACQAISGWSQSLGEPHAMEIGELLANVCEAGAKVIELQASRAAERDMCLKIKIINTPPPIPVPDIYRGKYCD